MTPWRQVLELGPDRLPTAGSPPALVAAIGRAADLRIGTDFVYNQHLDVRSDNDELVREVSDFPTTCCVDGRWAAGIMTYRLPIDPPTGFGPRPSMSFFLYNQDGTQAIARPFLDGAPAAGHRGPSPLDDHSDMPKYHQADAWDTGTNAPSSNFVYEFERYRFFVRDGWREVYRHDAHGTALGGSFESLVAAFEAGAELKVGIRGLCADLAARQAPDHEWFVLTGPGYLSTRSRVFCAGTRPVVRVAPGVPVRYASGNWDFGWLMPRTDGRVALWLCDPYTLQFRKAEGRFPIRWFAC
jgi:hypothetical protein